MDKKKQVPVTLLTGYLGSGKTTLMNHLLTNQEGYHIAVVVNDMGAVNIDAKLIGQSNCLQMDSMVQLQNGCICCTLRDEFMDEINRIAEMENIDYILVEASGISSPSSIADAFENYQDNYQEQGIEAPAYLDAIVSVVDANRIFSEFKEKLEAYDGEEDEQDIINLIVDQIEFCNIILLNKCDLLDETQIQEVIKSIRMIQPEAEMIRTKQSVVKPDCILGKKIYDYGKLNDSSYVAKALAQAMQDNYSETDEYGIHSFVFESRKPFVRERFLEWVEHFPENVIRAKGYLWFADDVNRMELFEQAGNSCTLTPVSQWVAAFSEEEKQDVFAEYPDTLEDWDSLYGDRMNQLVLIGTDYAETAIKEELDRALASGHEMEQVIEAISR